MPDVVSIKVVAAKLKDLWSPKIVGEVDDSYIKVAKIQGTFPWHAHDTEDEMFLVLKGSMKIEMENKTVELNEGDMLIVPKGVRHHPIADEECHIMLFERKTTLHTGAEVTEKTRSIEEQLQQD